MSKICHITSVHAPEDGRIFRRECVSTCLAGYETVLVQQGTSYTKYGVNILGIGVPKYKSRIYRFFVFSKKACKTALTTNSDIYHLHDPELLLYINLFKKRGKVVFDSHEDYPKLFSTKYYIPRPFRKIAGKFFESYLRKAYKKCDGFVVADNENQKEKYVNYCTNIAILDNFPWKSELYNKYDESVVKESNSACYIGGLSDVRCIDTLVEACTLAKCKLYLAGKFSSETYKEKILNNASPTNVVYLGNLGREEIFKLLQKVEIGFSLLKNVSQFGDMKNLPTKVYEYLSMGMPVILNKSEYNLEVTEKYAFGLCVDPNNALDVAEAITSITKSKDILATYSRNGRLASERYFSWDEEQSKLIELYSIILR